MGDMASTKRKVGREDPPAKTSSACVCSIVVVNTQITAPPACARITDAIASSRFGNVGST